MNSAEKQLLESIKKGDKKAFGHLFEKGEILAFEELFEQILIAVDKLPAKEKEVFLMSRFEHLKISEIADKL